MKRKNFVFVVFAAMLLSGCGETAHEHNLNSKWENDAKNHWHTCSGCDELVDSAAHEFEDVVTQPTFEAGGFTTHTCKVCGYSFKDNETQKKTHNFATEWSKDANKHWHACTDAGSESLKDGEANHTFSNVVTAPTYEAKGYTTHTCACGYSYTDTETDKLIPTKLAAPAISYDDASGKIKWDAVTNAAKYKVLDGTTVVAAETTDREVALSDVIGNHSITVVALTGAAAYSNSDASNAYAYETKAVACTSVTANNTGVITITGAQGTVSVLAKKTSALVADLGVNGSTTTVSASGDYQVVAKAVYDATNKVNYVGEDVTKDVRVIFDAAADVVLEDGTAESDLDLADKYVIQKFGTSDWEPTTAASVALSEANGDATEGKCVKLNFHNHGAWFRYHTDYEILDGFDGVSFTVKPSDAATSFIFRIIDATGVFASYKINALPNCWTKYSIRFDDAAWDVNQQGYSIAQVAALKGQSVRSIVAGVTGIELLAKHDADEYWSSNSMLIDDVTLVKTLAASKIEKTIVPYGEYIFEGGDTLVDIKISGETATLAATGWAVSSLDLSYAFENGEITFTNDNLTFVGTLSDDGKVLTYKSAEGALATYLPAGTAFKAGKLLDNFESYTETGTGYDQNNTNPANATGLRAAYYADYYTGGSGSPVGGNGWSLMGSTDYIQLGTSNGRGTSSKAFIQKVNNNTLRSMTGGLATGTATSCGIGSKLCFSIKGSTSGYTLSVRTFYTNRVTPSNQQSTTLTKASDISVASGTEWVNYSVDLKNDAEFYGFAFTFKNGPGSAIYVAIDNIYILY